jgi:glutamate carboxypeptidase
MTSLADRAADWLSTRHDEMEAFLQHLVDIDSNSFDKVGTDNVGAAIVDLLASDGITVNRVGNDTYGDCLKAEIPGRGANAHVLMMGHRDTVFPKGTTTTRGFSKSGNIAYGPGVADMKGGLVLNCFVLRALKAAGGADFPVVALFTADEEIGSPSGRAVIEDTARGARAVFNSEPGRVSGNVVTGRKGGTTLHIFVDGKAAHSGANHQDGASAIGALAAKVIKLHALTDYAAGITTNVGVIKGGMTHNTVAPTAECELDIRFIELAHLPRIMADIEAILAHEDVPGTKARYEQSYTFYPLEAHMSADLFERYQASAGDVGFKVAGEFTGGCSDAGFTAAIGVPSLCGLGPVGGKAHTEEEFLNLDTLVPRAQAMARTIAGM